MIVRPRLPLRWLLSSRWLLTSLFALVLLAPAGAQIRGNVQMGVRLATQDVGFLPGRWTAALVELIGDNVPRSLTVSLQSLSGPDDGAVISQDVELPASGEVRLTIPIFVDWVGDPKTFRVSAVDVDRRELVGFHAWAGVGGVPAGSTTPAPVTSRSPNETRALLAIIGGSPAFTQVFEVEASEQRLPPSVMSFSPRSAPAHPLGYDHFAAVLILEPDTLDLPPGTWDALETYVLGGGHVMLAGLRDEVARDAFPLARAAAAAGPLAHYPAADLFGPAAHPASEDQLALPLVPVPDTWTPASVPLAATVDLGFGRVTTLALPMRTAAEAHDLVSAGFRERFLAFETSLQDLHMPYWYGDQPVWSERLHGSLDPPALARRSTQFEPPLAALPWWFMVGWLVALAILLGPGEHQLHRRFGTFRLTWVILPVVLTVSCVCIVQLAYMLTSADTTVRTFHLVSWDPAQNFVSRSTHTSQFPGTSARFAVTAPEGSWDAVAALKYRHSNEYRPGGTQEDDRVRGGPRGRLRANAPTSGAKLEGRWRRLRPEAAHVWSFGREPGSGLRFTPNSAEGNPAGGGTLANEGDLLWNVSLENGVGPLRTQLLPPGQSLEIELARDESGSTAPTFQKRSANEVPHDPQATASYLTSVGIGAASGAWIESAWPGSPNEVDYYYGEEIEIPDRPKNAHLLHGGLHGWDGRPHQSRGRTLVTLWAAGGAPVTDSDANVFEEVTTVIKLLVPEGGTR